METLTCEDELQKVKDQLQEIRDFQEEIFPPPASISNQDNIPIGDYTGTYPVKEKYRTSGSLNTNIDLIDIIIPVTDEDIRIVNCINMSHKDINAILVVLSKENALPTDGHSITRIIKNQFKITELGLMNRLIKENKLLVIVLYDNNFTGTHVVKYHRIIDHHNSYEDIRDEINISIRPNEDGGDIIP